MSKLSNVVMKEGHLEALLNKGLKSLGDSVLLNTLRSEIKYELDSSSSKFQDDNGGSLGDFKLDWDSKLSQDILLRRKDESGEETVVSALLDPLSLEYKEYLPWKVMMKVCIKKPGLNSILQFDCNATSDDFGKSSYKIQNAYCIQSASKLQTSYGAYSYRNLNMKLRNELHKYLEARGIRESLTNFLLLHLHKKEQDRYLEWLQKLETTLAENE